MKPNLFAATLIVAISWCAPTFAAITIDTVPVGDAGNPNDLATSNLSDLVNYAYSIGKYEVTVGQYTAFLLTPFLLLALKSRYRLRSASACRASYPFSAYRGALMNIKQIPLIILVAAGGLLVVSAAANGQAYTMTWQQSGFFNQRDSTNGIVVDSNDQIYVAGESGPIYGSGVSGPSIGLLAKYNPAGTQQWLVPAYAAPGTDQPSGIAIDSSNNVYIAGDTYRYPGGTNAFLVKYDSSGNRLWEAHAGLPSSNNVFGSDVAVDVVGNVYLAGSTTGKLVPTATSHPYDGFIIKYAPNGSEIWRSQFADSLGDFADTISVDSSQNIFVAGTRGAVDTYIAKLDPNGNVLWRITPNFSVVNGRHTELTESTVDPTGNLYVVGATNSYYDNAYGFVATDGVVAKYDTNGVLLWQQQLRLRTLDDLTSVTLDAAGNVFVAGDTFDIPFALSGVDNSVWAKYDPSGNLLWQQEFGTPERDGTSGIAVDKSGHVYVSGNILRDYITNTDDYFNGDSDAYVARFDAVPEPSILLLAISATLGLTIRRSRA
jgi:hypothetical protein